MSERLLPGVGITQNSADTLDFLPLKGKVLELVKSALLLPPWADKAESMAMKPQGEYEYRSKQEDQVAVTLAKLVDASEVEQLSSSQRRGGNNLIQVSL